MKSHFKILDLFCGEGGAATGYYRAVKALRPGSHVTIVGIDIRPMKRYPFDFMLMSALDIDYDLVSGFDFIHASPPCKSYTRLYRFAKKDTDKTILPRTLLTLEATGKPYVCENVPQAPMRADVQLSGDMFGLSVIRKRIFQTNMTIAKYPQKTSTKTKNIVTVAGNSSTLKAASHAMGIDWMSKAGINEAIPPDYTYWIMSQMLERYYVG